MQIKATRFVAKPALMFCLITGLFFAPHAVADPLTLGPPPWDLDTGLRSALDALASAYMQGHPGASVGVASGSNHSDSSKIPGESLGDVMFVSGSDYGDASDLAILMQRGLVADLSSRVQSSSFDKGDFFQNLWEAVTIDNSIYAVPLLVRSWGLTFDTKHFTHDWAHQHFDSWENTLTCQASLIEDLNGDGNPDTSAIKCGLSPFTLWSALFLNYGGNPSATDSFCPASPAWQRATASFNSLLASNPLLFESIDVPTAINAMANPAIQFVHNDHGGTASFDLRTRGGAEWELIPAPGNAPLPPLDTTVIAIKRSTPEKEDAAWAFVQWMTSAPVMGKFFTDFHLTPVRHSLTNQAAGNSAKFFATQIERMKFQCPQAVANTDATALRSSLFSRIYGTNGQN